MYMYNRKTRRQFLRGASASLALPFLTSLWPREAWGADPGEKRFIAFWGENGGYSPSDLYPTYAASTPFQLYSNHTIYSSPLTLSPGLGSISKIYTAALNPYLSKLNVIEGLDCPIDFTHGEATFLGHYRYVRGGDHANLPTVDGDILKAYPDVPSIDQFLAYHPKFYKSVPVVRSIQGYASYKAKGRYRQKVAGDFTQGTYEMNPDKSPNDVFNKLFGSTTPPVTGGSTPSVEQTNSKTIVDQVVSELASLKNSRKISSADKSRLDDFATEIHELQQKLMQTSTTAAACVKPANPNNSKVPGAANNDDEIAKIFELYVGVIVAGIKCGRTRIATMTDGIFDVTGWVGDWHQWGHDGKTSLVANTLRFGLEKLFIPLLKGLDVEEANGKTYLDNSICVWGNNNSKIHKAWSRPILTAGSAGGFLKTGMYVDYRRRGVKCDFMYYATGEASHEMYPGIMYNQFLVTMLQAMGLSPSDYERPGVLGYSHATLMNNFKGNGLGMQDSNGVHVHAHCINDAGKVLPLLVNG